MVKQKRVFESVKAVGFTYAGTANMVLRTLGMFGATVVRVESHQRPCNLRSSAPFKDNKPGINRSTYYAVYNNDRYSLALNLKHPKSPVITRKLIEWADIVVENFSPGTVKRLGLDYERVKTIKPDVIMLSISQQGQTGPHSFMPGYGPQVQALTGHVHLCGWPDRAPALIDQSYPDFIAPPFGTIAVIAALDYKRRTGRGQYIDLSNYETALHWLSPVLLDYTVNQNIWQRQGNKLANAAPHGVYRCKGDDSWCAISVFTDGEWETFCGVMGNPSWTSDARFATLLERKRNEDELNRNIEEWTKGFTNEELSTRLQEAGVAAGKVQTCEDVTRDPQLRHRKYFRMLEHSEIGAYEYFSPSYILSRTPAEIRLPAPLLGEHSEYVCTKLLGIPDSEFIEMLADKVFE